MYITEQCLAHNRPTAKVTVTVVFIVVDVYQFTDWASFMVKHLQNNFTFCQNVIIVHKTWPYSSHKPTSWKKGIMIGVVKRRQIREEGLPSAEAFFWNVTSKRGTLSLKAHRCIIRICQFSILWKDEQIVASFSSLNSIVRIIGWQLSNDNGSHEWEKSFRRKAIIFWPQKEAWGMMKVEGYIQNCQGYLATE